MQEFRVAIVLECLLWTLLLVVHSLFFVALHVAVGLSFGFSIITTVAILLIILFIVSKVD
jgi:hypothetical protein